MLTNCSRNLSFLHVWRNKVTRFSYNICFIDYFTSVEVIYVNCTGRFRSTGYWSTVGLHHARQRSSCRHRPKANRFFTRTESGSFSRATLSRKWVYTFNMRRFCRTSSQKVTRFRSSTKVGRNRMQHFLCGFSWENITTYSPSIVLMTSTVEYRLRRKRNNAIFLWFVRQKNNNGHQLRAHSCIQVRSRTADFLCPHNVELRRRENGRFFSSKRLGTAVHRYIVFGKRLIPEKKHLWLMTHKNNRTLPNEISVMIIVRSVTLYLNSTTKRY